MIIYRIINTLNGKGYIGLTSKTLAKRWAAHKSDARRGSKAALHVAIRKHGESAFVADHVVSLLPTFTLADLQDLERAVIAQDGTFSFDGGYNRNRGGDGCPKGTVAWRRGKPLSAEHRANLAAAWARNPDRRRAQSERCKGIVPVAALAAQQDPTFLVEQAERLRVRNAEMNQSSEHKAKLKAAWARSPERRVKAAQTMARVMSSHQAERRVANG